MAVLAGERLAAGIATTVAAFGIASAFVLATHGTVAAWLLPVCSGLGVVAAATTRRRDAVLAGPPARVVPVAALLVAMAAIAIVTHGALATGSRHWDGAVAWDLKAQALAAAPTLEQPLFRDPGVYCHSRDYPLLQPLLVAAVGRALFPGVFATLLLAVWISARRTHGPTVAAGFAAAAALTPMFLMPTSGGFDSGYADGFVATALALAAAGLALERPLLLAAGIACAVLGKPEGLPYAGALCAAVFWRGSRAAVVAATTASGLAGALGLALQHDLLQFGATSVLVARLGAAAAFVVAVLGVDALLRRRGDGPRTRLLLLLLAAIPAAIVAAALLPTHGSLGSHLADGGRVLDRLAQVPRILAAIAEWAFASGRYGLLFVLPLLLLAATRGMPSTPARAPLWRWLGLALAVLVLPFVLSPIADVEHHLRSSLPRLLLHWTGVLWVACAATPWPRPTPTISAASPGT